MSNPDVAPFVCPQFPTDPPQSHLTHRQRAIPSGALFAVSHNCSVFAAALAFSGPSKRGRVPADPGLSPQMLY